MNTQLVIMTFLSIICTVLVSIILIKKNIYVRALTIFLGLYMLGQFVGYSLNIDILKAVVPSFSHPNNGFAYQVIPSIGFPLGIAFLIDYFYKAFKN